MSEFLALLATVLREAKEAVSCRKLVIQIANEG